MAVKVSAKEFVAFLIKQWRDGAGYIIGSTGQVPRNWSTSSWWFTQYSGSQRKKALYWREHANRVFDCNGLSEGFYKDKTGVDINTYARKNYANWCDPKGKGLIPAQHRIPGAAVFKANSGGTIHHVGYLVCPVKNGDTAGDWYVIEAKGVMYGVVRTKLSDGGWNRWGLMTKYYDYDGAGALTPDVKFELGVRALSKGCFGDDVKELQEYLIGAGYSCGKWGTDGDFGEATETAVIAWQYANGLTEDGVMDNDDYARIEKESEPEDEPEDEKELEEEEVKDDAPSSLLYVKMNKGNTIYIRASYSNELDGNGSAILGIMYTGEEYPYAGTTTKMGWHSIEFKDAIGWVSAKYTTVVAEPVSAPETPVQEAPAPELTIKVPPEIVGDLPRANPVIIDLSEWNALDSAKTDWALLKKNVDLVILRCGVTRTTNSPKGIGPDHDFELAAARCNEYGIPFGAYYYGKVKTVEEAKQEAEYAWNIAYPFKPLFFAYDVEEPKYLTNKIVKAWMARIRELGAKKVGVYVGHHLYAKYKDALTLADFKWVPRYGKNSGKILEKYFPAYPCDLHQYTSKGNIPGLADKTADVNRLTGAGHDLAWFLSR